MQTSKLLQSTSLRVFSRGLASAPSEATVARYTTFGNLSLKLEKEAVPSKLGNDEVLVKMLLAPISPVDIATIRGYSFGTAPGVPGIEGVGEVVAVGSGVKDFKANDLVIPLNPKNGTWRTHLVSSSNDLFRVPEKVTPEDAATISVAPVVALSLLNNYVKLGAGDLVIQNGAESSVGTAVVQVAQQRNIKTINVVPNKQDYESFAGRLQNHGAYVVVTPEYLRLPQFNKLLEGASPKLGLNLTGGSVATEVARKLAPGGTLVTYGGMSNKPVTIPTSLFIDRGISLQGFSLRRVSIEERKKLITEAISLGIRSYVERHKFTDLQNALDAHFSPKRSRKVLLVFDK